MAKKTGSAGAPLLGFEARAKSLQAPGDSALALGVGNCYLKTRKPKHLMSEFHHIKTHLLETHQLHLLGNHRIHGNGKDAQILWLNMHHVFAEKLIWLRSLHYLVDTNQLLAK